MSAQTDTATVTNANRAICLPDAFLNFDHLPNSGLVDQRVVKLLFDCSDTTIWRRVKRGQLPQPQRYGQCTRWRVGDLRALLNPEAA